MEIDTYDSGTYKIASRYDYNGVHWRTRKLSYLTPGGTTAQERVYTHGAGWQAIVEEIDDNYTVGGSSNVLERVAQQVFGIRGVNDAVYRIGLAAASASVQIGHPTPNKWRNASTAMNMNKFTQKHAHCCRILTSEFACTGNLCEES